MLLDTTILAEIVSAPKTRSGENTLLKKTMKNGASIILVGAKPPGGFQRITVRIVLFDEVDGYSVVGAGLEGDQRRFYVSCRHCGEYQILE
ncbi:Phage terminase [Commensalibacter communis]|uniref:phage terminase large subunit family protein n=1 Tax=Commensalibacter communis TaxID=2972786 RepID=UPI0022FFB13E|nr:phage terminase large subunit family protein [Commensalibacter communis]CAI3959594.1 Phage terminase [Commensalibacter communis]CAI3960089.1 Phage terminase [Commensalibacter communis]